jgi:hypothetical protein
MWRIVRLAALALIVALGPAALDSRQAKTGEAARLQAIVDGLKSWVTTTG